MEKGRAAIVDVETTGMSSRDEIVEIAILLFSFDRETGRFLSRDDYYQGYQEPSFEIAPEATRVHGLTRENLRGRRIDRSKVRELLGAADFLVAHNAVFDRSFICSAFPEFRGKEWHCSMRSINWIATGCRNKQLQTILAHHSIIPTRAHSADDDVACLFELLGRENRRTSQPFFMEVMNALPVRTSMEMSREGNPGKYLYGIYVDEWKKWMASYLKSNPRIRQRKWDSLSPERQDYLRAEYGIREHDTLFS